MKIFTVQELLELEPKTPVSAMRGKLVKVWPAKYFTFKKGPRKGQQGSVQNLVLEDDTGQINVKNWSESLPKSDQGETFLFESHPGKKGLTGLVIDVDNYNKANIVSMNENAKIKAPDGTPAKSGSGRTEPGSPNPAVLAARTAAGCRLSMKLALALAQEMKSEYAAVLGHAVGPDQVNSWASSINYYLRDQGALKYMGAPESKPEPLKEPETDDEIPF